jgi:hypothetical protein
LPRRGSRVQIPFPAPYFSGFEPLRGFVKKIPSFARRGIGEVEDSILLPQIFYLKKMRKLTMVHYRYTVDILPEEDGKGYYASVQALPGCFSQGKTIEETKKNTQAAIKLLLRH